MIGLPVCPTTVHAAHTVDTDREKPQADVPFSTDSHCSSENTVTATDSKQTERKRGARESEQREAGMGWVGGKVGFVGTDCSRAVSEILGGLSNLQRLVI